MAVRKMDTAIISGKPLGFMLRFRSSIRAVGAHFVGSTLVAMCIALVVFFLWYPWPFYEVVRGRELFWLVIAVDAVCGPLLTAVLWNHGKSRKELALDVGLVVLIQLGALGYGLHAVVEARPVRLAFEVDRFRLVTAAEVDLKDLHLAPPPLQRLPWNGPELVGIRNSRSGEETLRSIELSLGGQEPSLRPGWWQSYNDSRSEVQQRMKSIAVLRAARSPSEQREIDAAVQKAGLQLSRVSFLPLVSQKSLDNWIVLMDEKANIVGYAPVGGF